MKICNKCEIEKPHSEFYRSKNTKDGLCSSCKECRKKYNRTAKEAKLYYDNHLEAHLVATAKYRAKKRNLEFNLKPEDIIIPEKCPLLGIVLHRGTVKENANSPSIDRIDAKRGYTKDNIWIISKRANSIKINATVQEIAKVANSFSKISGFTGNADTHSGGDTIPPELHVTLLSILKINSNNCFEIIGKINGLISNNRVSKEVVKNLKKENTKLKMEVKSLEHRCKKSKNEIDSLKNLLEIERMPLEIAA